MREEDFIELDFDEEQSESIEQPRLEKKDSNRKKGRFFVSYPKKKRQTDVEKEEEIEKSVPEIDLNAETVLEDTYTEIATDIDSMNTGLEEDVIEEQNIIEEPELLKETEEEEAEALDRVEEPYEFEVKEVLLPGVEDLPDFDGGDVYGISPEESSVKKGLSAVPKERTKITWYLTLPFITLILLIPGVGIVGAGVLLYLRYKNYGVDQQVNDLTTAYILLVACLIIAFWAIYFIVAIFGHTEEPPQEAVPGQAEREAAESLARKEAEEKEQQEAEARLRTSAQADIGLEKIQDITEGVAEDTLEAIESLTAEENTAPGDDTGNLWDAFLNKLIGDTAQEDQAYIDNVAADLQELSVLGDGSAQYSLQKLAAEVTLFSASYDDRFLGERQALFAFMSNYQGMQLDNQTFNLKSSLIDMFSGTVHWDATLDNTQYRYIGSIEDGMPQGMGVVLVASSVNNNTYIPLYAGTFVNGTLEGYGMAFKENSGYYGILYEGYFSAGKYAGKGTAYEIPSSVNFQNRLSMQDMAGNQYTADEVNEILNAYAVRYSGAMHVYEAERALYAYIDVPVLMPVVTERGRFAKGNLNGYCIQYGSFGIRQYAGILKNGVRSGLGTSYYADGAIEYDGEWKNGRYHGTGTLYNPDGSIWYDGEFSGGDIKAITQ